MIEEIYTYLTKKKKKIIVTFLVSDLPSGYINIELLGELPTSSSFESIQKMHRWWDCAPPSLLFIQFCKILINFESTQHSGVKYS